MKKRHKLSTTQVICLLKDFEGNSNSTFESIDYSAIGEDYRIRKSLWSPFSHVCHRKFVWLARVRTNNTCFFPATVDHRLKPFTHRLLLPDYCHSRYEPRSTRTTLFLCRGSLHSPCTEAESPVHRENHLRKVVRKRPVAVQYSSEENRLGFQHVSLSFGVIFFGWVCSHWIS
jgi:hypothetical protein